MALSAVRGLLVARARSLLNQMRRDSGSAGEVSALVLAAVVALVLALPALTLGRLGMEFGLAWASAGGEPVAGRWAALQAVFTLAFPLLGAARFRPVFEHDQIGALPVSGGELFAAELPATLFEVFPLLGVLGVVASNAGLGAQMPALSVLAILLGLQGAIWIAALTSILGGFWRAIPRWIGLSAILVCGVATLAAASRAGGRAALRAIAAGTVRLTPGSWICTGFDRFQADDAGGAALCVAAAAAATGLLVLAAAAVRRRLLRLEPARGSASWLSYVRVGSRRPAGAICRLTLIQLFAARGGRVVFLLPFLITLPATVAVLAIRLDGAELRLVPERLAQVVSNAGRFPWYAIVAVAAVMVDSAIWFNPFGWFGSGVRTLLALPVASRDLLRGMLGGFATFAGAQAGLACLPLLVLRGPGAGEMLVGLGGAVFALFSLGGAGQALGLQFARSVSREGGAEIPFHLSWIPLLLSLTTMAVLMLAYRLAVLISIGAPAIALPAVAAAGALGYRTLLPLLEAEVGKRRERLLLL